VVWGLCGVTKEKEVKNTSQRRGVRQDIVRELSGLSGILSYRLILLSLFCFITFAATAAFAAPIVIQVDGSYRIEGYFFTGSGATQTTLFEQDFRIIYNNPLEIHTLNADGSTNWSDPVSSNVTVLQTPADGSPMRGCYGSTQVIGGVSYCPDGVYAANVTSRTPVEGSKVFYASVGGSDTVSWTFDFWVPEVEFVDVDGNPWNGDIDLQTSEQVKVYARLLDYEGNLCHEGDPDNPYSAANRCNLTLGLRALAGSENLVFYDALTGQTEIDSIQFESSQLEFYVGANGPVSGGGFVLEGYPANGTNRISESFPSGIDFSYPDAAVLDSAWVLDSDGDGYADSIVAWYDRALDGLPDTLQHSWPDKDDDLIRITTGGGYDSNRVEMDIEEISALGDSLDGELRSVVESEGGRMVTSRTDLVDKIGPVIRSGTVIDGVDDENDPDTLIVVFSKALDPTTTDGEVLLINGEAVNVTSEQISDLVWQFVVPPGIADEGDSLKLVHSDGIIAADGNEPSRNNQPVVLGDAGKIPPVTDDGNGFYDSDEDGIMDSVVVEFVNPLSAADIDNLDLRIVWLDSVGNKVELNPNSDDFVIDPDNPARISWKIPDSIGLENNLTAIFDETYGYANLVSSYEINGETLGDTLAVPMKDLMAPVIDSAFVYPELSNAAVGDSLIVFFSEPIDVQNLDQVGFLRFKIGNEERTFNLDDLFWYEDSMSVGMRIAADDPLDIRPNAGDSIKIISALDEDGNVVGIQDLHGNPVRDNSPYVMMQGNPRILLEYVDIIGVDREELNRAYENGEIEDPVTLEFVPDDFTAEDAEDAGALGFLVDFGASPLDGDLDEDGEPSVEDLHEIFLKYEVYYYTNLGGFVTSASGKVFCDDPEFSDDGESEGNCFKNRRKLLVRWNMLSDEGRVVGFGAYVSKLYLYVKGSKSNYEETKTRIIGVKAGQGSYNRSVLR